MNLLSNIYGQDATNNDCDDDEADGNNPSGEEDPRNFHLWKGRRSFVQCLIYKALTKWSILRNITFKQTSVKMI